MLDPTDHRLPYAPPSDRDRGEETFAPSLRPSASSIALDSPGGKLLASLRSLAASPRDAMEERREDLTHAFHAILREPEREHVTIISQLLTEGSRLHLGDRSEYLKAATWCVSHAEHMARHSKDLSRVCWALGEMKVSDGTFWHGIERYSRDHFHRLPVGRAVTLAESAVKSGFSEPELFVLLARKILRRPCALSHEDRQRSGWAFSSLNLFHPRLLGGISGAGERALTHYSAEEKSRALHALSILGVVDHPVLGHLAAAAIADIYTAPTRDISSLATVLSRLPRSNRRYFEALCSTLNRRAGELSGVDVAELARAFLRLPEREHAPWDTLCERALELMGREKLSLHNLCDLLDGLAFGGHVDPELLAAGQEHLARGIDRLPPSNLARAAESLARLREPAPLFFAALPGDVARRSSVRPLATQRLSQIVHALGELRHPMGEAADLALVAGRDTEHRGAARDFARMAYALLMESETHAREMFPHAVRRAEQAPRDLTPPTLLHLYWTSRALREELPPPLEAQAAEFVAHCNGQSIPLNALERRVEHLLRSIGAKPEAQVPVHGFHIDFVVRHPRGDVAIECDGVRVHHVGRVSTGPLLGRYVVRDKVLSGAGFRIVHLTNPSLEFEAELKELLRKELAA